MKKIPGVSYPIDQDIRGELARFPRLARRISLPSTSRSDREIIRLLGNTHFEHVRALLEFLDRAPSATNPLLDEIVKQTDPMELNARIAELYLFCHFSRHMPGCVELPAGNKSAIRPDMIVHDGSMDVAVEVYGPANLFGFQLVESYASRVLKYLDVEVGYRLNLQIEPVDTVDLFFAYNFEAEHEIFPWLREFAAAAAKWLSNPAPKPVLKMFGPKGKVWKITVKIEEICGDRGAREIYQTTATRSDDARLLFDVGTAEDTACGWWGRSIKKKIAQRQAGKAPKEGLMRMLILDFSRLDTFPDFIAWPRISERIDASIRLVVEGIGGQLPYEVVLPARLGSACCFGTPVWLSESGADKGRGFVASAALDVPCAAPIAEAVDWPSILGP